MGVSTEVISCTVLHQANFATSHSVCILPSGVGSLSTIAGIRPVLSAAKHGIFVPVKSANYTVRGSYL